MGRRGLEGRGARWGAGAAVEGGEGRAVPACAEGEVAEESGRGGGRAGAGVSASGLEAAVWAALAEVRDPELPISVVDLGLIYRVRVDGTRVEVWVTFTATACPCMDFIIGDVRARLLREPWVEEVVVHEVWDPPWTKERITGEGRERLRSMGVGV